jgi:hypothetical protein
MGRQEKLLNRLLRIPKDFTWDELANILSMYGYVEIKKGKTGGSRRKFMNINQSIISLHKPHPSNILKEYVLKQVIAELKEKGFIR